MISSGFALLLSICLTFGIFTLGEPNPAIAAPSQSSAVSTLGATMAKKSLFSFSGKRPTALGVQAGQLVACPDTPNCVCSQAPDSDAEHKIQPIAYSSAPADALAKLKSIVESQELTKIITTSDDYLYAEFTSPLMGFVDDVEFYLDRSANAVQVRSASRLGQSDLGVNRKRIEAIRSKFTELGS
jgi:uncharacterized protein (DUF1499 family)